LIFLSAVVDEVASDQADKRSTGFGFWQVMKERPFMKVVVFFLCVGGTISSFCYLFAFLALDMAYSFVERIPMRSET
jgi:hypothetical protein